MSLPEDRHHIVLNSSNKMIPGGTVVSLQVKGSCPDSCPLLGDGCHYESGNAAIHRKRHEEGEYAWYSFDELIPMIRRFTRIHRSQVSGDLWATDITGEMIDPVKLTRYIDECVKHKLLPIIYTHKAVVGDRASLKQRLHNMRVLRGAKSKANFAINVSLDSIDDIDQAMDLGLDVVSVVPNKLSKGKLAGPKVFKTKKGRKVVTCPGKYNQRINCMNCGRGKPLCTRKGRDYAIGFPATGGARKALNIID